MAAIAEWRFTLIPLGVPSWEYSEQQKTWSVKAPLSVVSFLTIADEYSAEYVRQWISGNGIWAASRLGVAIIDGHGKTQTQRGTLSARWTQGAMQEQQKRLIAYLTYAIRSTESSIKHAERLPRDQRFDGLTTNDFSNSPGFYERTIPRRDALALKVSSAVAGALRSSSTDDSGMLTGPSIKVLSLLNSYLMEQLITEQSRGLVSDNVISAILNDAETFKANEAEAFLRDQSVLIDRVFGYEPNDVRLTRLQPINSVPEEKLKFLTEGADPNHLLVTALKDPTLARELGLVTAWTLEIDGLDRPPAGNELSLGLQLDISSLPAIAGLSNVTQPTMFRLGDEISPLPRNANLGTTGALAWLNGRAGGNDYKAQQVDADNELLKSWVTQNSNTVNTRMRARTPASGVETYPGGPPRAIAPEQMAAMNVDERVRDQQKQQGAEAPQGLPGAQFGVNEPATAGITFSACVDDLVSTTSIYPGVAGALYLEDLWIGYRIDIARLSGEAPRFHSLHEQDVKVTLADGTVINVKSENYVEREQLADTRPTTTEFARWSGIGTAQHYPLGQNKPGGLKHHPDGSPAELHPLRLPYTIKTDASDSSLPRLWHPNRYSYVVRNVFLGGMSVTITEAETLLSNPETKQSRRAKHIQEFGFYRTEALSCGTILVPQDVTADTATSGQSEQTIYLTRTGQRRTAFIAPRPLDLQQARFMGLIGSPDDDIDRLADVALLSDLRTDLLDAHGALRPIRYFLDSQVRYLLTQSYCWTRNPLRPPSEHDVDNLECTTLDPWLFATARLSFSKTEDWHSFRPKKLKFIAAEADENGGRPAARADQFQLEVYIPPGDVVDMSILPDISSEDIKSTYFYQNASKRLPQSVAASPSPTPPIINERRVRIVHATPVPLEVPRFEFDPRFVVRSTSDATQTGFRMPRDPNSNKGFVVGMVTVHAATTGEIYITATWTDIHEETVSSRGYTTVEGQYRTPSRSVRFAEREPPNAKEAMALLRAIGDRDAALAALDRRANEICLENVIHLRQPPAEASRTSGGAQYNVIEFNDGRRKLVTLRVTARARYAALYAGTTASHELPSRDVAVDAPNRNIPPQIRVKEVVPTFRERVASGADGARQISSEVGLRLYLNSPLFSEVGPGARCGIAVLDSNDYEHSAFRPYGSHWGEDPIEHPRLPVSTRVPLASDFVVPDDKSREPLDRILYPESVLLERSEVLYDRVALDIKPPSGNGIERVHLSLASFALRYVPSERCYFFDLLIKEGFIGWLRLSLYLHQPQSVPGYSISAVPTHVYASIIDEAPVVSYMEADWSLIRIGPVFDRTVSFVAYRARGIADGSFLLDAQPLQFEEIRIENQRFFSLRTKPPRETLCIHKVCQGAVAGALII